MDTQSIDAPDIFDDDDWNPYLERDKEIIITGDRLPHWQQDGKYVFYTFRLADSLPQSKIHELNELRQTWLSLHPKPWTAETESNFKTLLSKRIERLIDAGYGECLLKRPGVADIVSQSMFYNDGNMYQLVSFVVMANHVHALVLLLGKSTVPQVVNTWKSYTAHAINHHLHRKGSVWFERYFDRLIRSEEHYKSVIRYIANNNKHGGLAYYI